MLYIFDIDGTLADISHRLHFIQGETKDWDGFYKACVDDKPIFETIAIARALSVVVKSELLNAILGVHTSAAIGGVFEDRQQVVDMYRARGLRVFQVAKGDF